MGGLHFLNLIIVLVFVYFLLSLICVSLQELKANLINERSKDLEKWIKDTFNSKSSGFKKSNESALTAFFKKILLGKNRKVDFFSKGLGDKIWNNILVDGLTREGRTASYIPKEVFVSALLDEIYYGSDDSNPDKCEKCGRDIQIYNPKNPYDFSLLQKAIENPAVNLPIPLQRVIKQIYFESHQNLETFKMRMERWFEMAMERNTGTYKKKAQKWTLIFSVLVTISFNVDTLTLANFLYHNEEITANIANSVETKLIEMQDANPEQKDELQKHAQEIKEYYKTLNNLNLPIGWKGVNFHSKFIPGWIITIFAVSLGAPFWFDTLNKMVNLRSAGKMPNGSSHLASAESLSKDKQPAVG